MPIEVAVLLTFLFTSAAWLVGLGCYVFHRISTDHMKAKHARVMGETKRDISIEPCLGGYVIIDRIPHHDCRVRVTKIVTEGFSGSTRPQASPFDPGDGH